MYIQISAKSNNFIIIAGIIVMVLTMYVQSFVPVFAVTNEVQVSQVVNNLVGSIDTDGDGILDSVDTDDDNDGVSDVDEVADSSTTTRKLIHDTNADDTNDGIDDLDGDGKSNASESNAATTTLTDADGDGIPDHAESSILDADNDGVSDELDSENNNPYNDTDGDGYVNMLEHIAQPQTSPFIATEHPDLTIDSDFDGLPDAVDPDSTKQDIDGDGIPDGADFDVSGDGTKQNWASYIDRRSLLDTDGDGIHDAADADQNPLEADTDSDGVIDKYDLDDDGDGIKDRVEDANHNGVVDPNETDPKKADTDGDLILDGVEVAIANHDLDGDGIRNALDPTNNSAIGDADADGIIDADEYDYNGDGQVDDSDGDLIPDYFETDADNDGVLDTDEYDANGDRDGDGVPNYKDYDPQGYFYDRVNGQIAHGGVVSVTGPGVIDLKKNGADGEYKWYTDGTPGTYTMVVNTIPAGYTLASAECPVQATAIDPTGHNDPYIVGSVTTPAGTHLADFSCGANAYYLTFDLAAGDPEIFNNNIPLNKIPTPPSSSSGSGGGGQSNHPVRPHTINNLSVTAATSTVQIDWNTLAPANADITILNAQGIEVATSTITLYKTDQSLLIQGLAPNSAYKISVTSTNAQGRIATAHFIPFITQPKTAIEPPVVQVYTPAIVPATSLPIMVPPYAAAILPTVAHASNYSNYSNNTKPLFTVLTEKLKSIIDPETYEDPEVNMQINKNDAFETQVSQKYGAVESQYNTPPVQNTLTSPLYCVEEDPTLWQWLFGWVGWFGFIFGFSYCVCSFWSCIVPLLLITLFLLLITWRIMRRTKDGEVSRNEKNEKETVEINNK